MNRKSSIQKTAIIYNSLLVAIIGVIFALPLVKVPITISSRGAIRPAQENNKILSLVSGRVIQSNVEKNNQLVKKGDTLLVITSEVLHNKKRHQERLGISESRLYVVLDELKLQGAPIAYCRQNKTYFYDTSFEISIQVNISNLTNQEVSKINGGQNIFADFPFTTFFV